MGNTFAEIVGGLLTIALVTTIVAHPRSSNVIKAAGGAFTGAEQSSMGYGPAGSQYH